MPANQQTPDSQGIRERLGTLHRASEGCIGQSVIRHPAELGRILQLDADIGSWEAFLIGRPEHEVLAKARQELGFTVYSASSGLYLQAFANLRIFLELSFAAIAFSMDDLRRRQWMADEASFSFTKKVVEDDGFFSPTYLKAYRPAAINEAAEFREMARATYHHCSQFVHGKLPVTERLPPTLTFSDDALVDWARTARDAARCVIFILYCRYADQFLPIDDGRLAETLSHTLGHLPSVRRTLGLPLLRRDHNASA